MSDTKPIQHTGLVQAQYCVTPEMVRHKNGWQAWVETRLHLMLVQEIAKVTQDQRAYSIQYFPLDPTLDVVVVQETQCFTLAAFISLLTPRKARIGEYVYSMAFGQWALDTGRAHGTKMPLIYAADDTGNFMYRVWRQGRIELICWERTS